MQIIDVNIDDIKEYANNPRKNDEAVKPLAESIKRFGFKIPIVIDKNNVIVCGHTRIKAARLLGMTEIPCVMADDLTPEEIDAFRLADNKVGEIAEWDIDLLASELKDITDIDMSDFGFDISALADEPERKEQEISASRELEISDYDDEKFECECPKCGFKFNR